MAIRNIIDESDERLFKKSRKVEAFDERLHTLLDDMADTMYESNGVGIAAVQVGILKRAFLVDVLYEDDSLIEFINPEIISKDGEQTGREGCLSFPNLFGDVTRPNNVKIKAQDRFGDYFEVEAMEFFARAICHEFDHIDGHVFTELASNLMSGEEIERLEAIEAQKESGKE